MLTDRIIVTSPFQQITDRPTSHRSAQAYIYADELFQGVNEVTINVGGKIKDFSDYTLVAVYHGNDFQGGLNLYGGIHGFDPSGILALSRVPANRVLNLGNIEFPDYGEMLRPRIEKARESGKPYPSGWDQVDLDNLSKMAGKKSAPWHYLHWSPTTLTVGDSHAISMYQPGHHVHSIPFKTLHGALKVGLKSYMEEFLEYMSAHPAYLYQLNFYFGNIDIRHHVCREGNWKENVNSLCERYADQVIELENTVETKVFELLPIEDESRALPKTGYYKGQPFWGSWEERNKSRLHFRDRMIQLLGKDKVILWTDYLLNDAGQLDFKHMEKPKSVHLARSSYPYWTGIEKARMSDDTLETFLL